MAFSKIRSNLSALIGLLDNWAAPYAPYWLQLRNVGNSPIARMTILIPLIGYWIIFNAQLSTALVKPLAATAEGPSWRLFASYFGLCFIAAATAIYQWKCPSEIKLYPSASTYVGEVGSQMSRIELERVELILREGDEESRARHEGQMQGLDLPSQPSSVEEIERRRSIARSNILQLHYDYCNRSAPLARLITSFCNRIGIVVLLFPAADIFMRVSGALVRQIVRLFT